MIVEKGKLKSALTKISVFVDRDVNGVGSKILFSSRNGTVSITACDGANVGVFSFPVAERNDVEFVTEYKALASAAALRGDVQMEYRDHVLTVVQGDTTMVFPAMERDTYAFEEKAVEGGADLSINSSLLKSLIGKVSYARREKDSRAFVTGVHVKLEHGRLMSESTDALRMLRDHVKVDADENLEFSGVLGSKCIRAIETMDDDREIVFSMNDSAVGFRSDDMRVFMPKLNCIYPDASRFFQVNARASFVLNKAKVLESMEILALSENKALKCRKHDSKIVFSMEDGISDVKDKVEMESSQGESFEFCMDFEHFRDIFRNLRDGSSNVTFYWQDPTSLILFKDEENFEGVVMPLRK